MTSEDINFLFQFLYQHSAKWRSLGVSLKFHHAELEIIHHSKANFQDRLEELLANWSQWPTADHPDFPTLERLCDALRSEVVGLGAVAARLYERKNDLLSQRRTGARLNHMKSHSGFP